MWLYAVTIDKDKKEDNNCIGVKVRGLILCLEGFWGVDLLILTVLYEVGMMQLFTTFGIT